MTGIPRKCAASPRVKVKRRQRAVSAQPIEEREGGLPAPARQATRRPGSASAGKIVKLALYVPGACGAVDVPTQNPLSLSLPINRGAFSTKLILSGGFQGDRIQFAGRFNGKTVTGTLSGHLHFSANNKSCSATKQTFRASR